nr:uncharacterized protein LOC123745173 [Procambarus clarkii]
MGEKNASWPVVEEEEEAGLGHVRDYFTYLKTPQAGCRKLLTMGGLHKCGDVTDKLPDGSKVVCMDAPLGLPPAPDSRTCLTLSFGINVDVSFDEAVSKLNCEVHMFDLLDHAPATLLSRFKHIHFHNVGLGEARRQNYYLNIQQEIPVDSLSGILLNQTFIGRSLTILKIDIENDEWKVLRKIVQAPFMDIIGQIAIEIHAMDLTTLPPHEHLAYVRQRYDVLKALEGRGFRKVAYWDNEGSATYSDSSGDIYNTCGEVHYVNSNWYNETFKQRYKDIGFEFR